jgi:hypothetical protein
VASQGAGSGRLRSPVPGRWSDVTDSAESDGLLTVVKNLSRYHREHEKYYSEAPLADAIGPADAAVQRTTMEISA